MPLDLPPQLILPDHYVAKRPAIIRAHEGDADGLRAMDRERGIRAILPGMVPVVVTSRFQALYQDARQAGTGAPYSFAGVNIGTPAAGRRLIIAVYTNQAATVSSVTVASVSAALLYRPGDAQSQPEFWSVLLESGSTATVVVAYSGSNDRCAIGVWSILHWSGSLVASAKNGAGAVVNPSLSIASRSGGCVIAAARTLSSGSFDPPTTGSWSGATHRFLQNPGTGGQIYSAGADAAGTGSNMPISWTTANSGRLAAVSI